MSRIYIGNLPLDIRESELDDLFYKYGKIREIDLKTPARPPAFAFISFDDHRDAEDAIRGRDNYNYDGYRLRVEFAKGNGRGGGGRIDDRRDAPRRGGGGGRRSDHGVLVSNLPRGCSWQDLKDFMRKAGDVIYTDVDKYGDGVVEFSNRDDMEYALRTLDDTEFKNYNESSYIRVKPRKDGGRGRSEDRHGGSGRASSKDRRRSPSPRRSRSRSPSPRRSRSPSPRRSPSRSRSRSRDRLGDKRDGGGASDDEGGRKKSRADGDEDDAPRGDSADDKSAKEEED